MNPILAVIGVLRIWLARSSVVEAYQGIQLASDRADATAEGGFVDKTKQAIDLIHSVDRRRFLRAKRHIKYIYDVGLHPRGALRNKRLLLIDFKNSWNFYRHPEWSLYLYSGSLVYCATIARIQSFGIVITKENWLQVWRICIGEENRFLAKIEPSWGDRLQLPTDCPAWSSRSERIRKSWLSLRESIGKRTSGAVRS